MMRSSHIICGSLHILGVGVVVFIDIFGVEWFSQYLAKFDQMFYYEVVGLYFSYNLAIKHEGEDESLCRSTLGD